MQTLKEWWEKNKDIASFSNDLKLRIYANYDTKSKSVSGKLIEVEGGYAPLSSEYAILLFGDYIIVKFAASLTSHQLVIDIIKSHELKGD